MHMQENTGVCVKAVSGEGLGYLDRMFLFTLFLFIHYSHTHTNHLEHQLLLCGFIYQPHNTHAHTHTVYSEVYVGLCLLK